MTALHRFEAHAAIEPGEHERNLAGELVQLVRVVLSDDGPVAHPDGTDHHHPDVICLLNPDQARALAARLRWLADHATRPERNTR